MGSTIFYWFNDTSDEYRDKDDKIMNIENENLWLIELLIKEGADVNKQNIHGKTVLHVVAEKGDYELAEILLNAGGDVNILDEDEFTPIDIAISSSNYGVFNIYLSSDKVSNQTKNNCLMYHARNWSTIKVLIESGADINSVDDDGNTILHDAVINRRIEIVKMLIEAGADIDLTNNDGKTCLDIAIQNKDREIAHILIDAQLNEDK